MKTNKNEERTNVQTEMPGKDKAQSQMLDHFANNGIIAKENELNQINKQSLSLDF